MALQHGEQHGELPSPRGHLSAVKQPIEPWIQAARDGRLVQGAALGHYRPERESLLHRNRDWHPHRAPQQGLLRLVDRVRPGLSRRVKQVVLGHDAHVSLWAELYIRHFHHGWRDPFVGGPPVDGQALEHWQRVDRRFQRELERFPPEQALAIALGWPVESAALHFDQVVGRGGRVRAEELARGWWEDVGLVSQGLVTTAFRDFLAAQLVTDSSAIGDFKFHRPGTSNTAENNTHTGLQTDAGLEATGNQTNPSGSTYQSVGTVTADSSETWQEHSIRNATGASGGTMLDRSLISPTVAVVNLDTVEFTYVLTVNAEA
jgi:hypothetical protein